MQTPSNKTLLEVAAMGQVHASNLKVRRLPLLGLVAVLAALAFLLASGPVWGQDRAIKYAENGEDAVATFTAEDPEGITPVTWSLATAAQVSAESDLADADNTDSASFEIDKDGNLNFVSPPDYEASTTGDGGGDTDNDNTYKVVVVACDVALDGDGACPTTGKAGFHKVVVEVTDVDETGKVSWTVDADGSGGADTPTLVQFQVGASLAASVTDGDIAGSDKAVTIDDGRWRWYRSPNKTAMGEIIEGETGATYTVAEADAGMYLRVEAFYNVGTGLEESASLTSDYPVMQRRLLSNKLKFDPASVDRSVLEGEKGMNVGAPVTATGAHGAVNYTLTGTIPQVGGTDAFKIDQKTGQITTVVDLNYDGDSPSCTDNECTVMVRATDASGDATAATAATNVFVDATVTIEIRDVNEKPEFATDTSGTPAAASPKAITSPENRTALFPSGDPATTAVDVTYAATDPERLRVNLTLMGADRAKFQLSGAGVLSFSEKPDYEKPSDANRDNVYEVTVRASDGVLHEDRMVKVTVTKVDEAPEIMGNESFSYAENGEDAVATFTAEDPEGITPVTWSLATAAQVSAESDLADADNTDSASFEIDKDGNLNFVSPPDYEASTTGDGGGDTDNDNTYKVVVVACDVALDGDGACPTTGKAGFHKVVVEVTDVDETGKVSWTVDADGSGGADTPTLVQFQVGASLAASVTDGDIAGSDKAVTAPRWRWYRGSARIEGETGATYTVVEADIGKRLRVEAFYNVGGGSEEKASLTSDYPMLGPRDGANKLKFDPASVDRSVLEGEKGMNVGAPVTATGAHGAVNYTLTGTIPQVGGTDAFKIDQKTGQITTVVDLNYDGDSPSCTDNECTVMVRATDASGDATAATAATNVFVDATVTIEIRDVNEKPEFATDTSGTPAAASPKAITSPENRTALFPSGDPATTAVDVTYAATDPERLNVTLTLMGADRAKFQLSGAGVLSFSEKPDYEKPSDANRDNVYEVTVRASDGVLHEDRMVKVTVDRVDEAPEIMVVPASGLRISGKSSQSVAENTTAVGTYTASGPNAASARWTVSGADRALFTIGDTTGALAFSVAPDYETPGSAANSNTYSVTVMARDSEGQTDSIAVTVTVTDVTEQAPTNVVERYDTDNSGRIDKGELANGVFDYEIGGTISKDDLADLIFSYEIG